MTYKLEFTVGESVFDVTDDNLNLLGLTDADLAVMQAFLNLGLSRYHAERYKRSPNPQPPPF